MFKNLFKKSSKVVTRFAPSPTGLLHVGNYRTALFAYLFARQNGGRFILRIEDTDKARSKKEYEDNIIESLRWLGLEYDDFSRQSERAGIHASYIQKLIDSGHAFISKETPKNEGDRAEVIRFKNPNKKVTWTDLIRGDVTFDTTDLGDFIIARSMTEPVFHLVVVADDHDSGVTHVIRGEDHISNTPRHILISEALGFKPVVYAHLPLLLSPSRSKLSKRDGALPVTAYRDRGYLPEAIVNYMALLGWNPGVQHDGKYKDQEIFSRDELIKIFDLSKVQKSGAIFDEEKLKWINKQYINKLSDVEFAQNLSENLDLANIDSKLIPLIREKINTFGEIKTLFEEGNELGFVNKKFDKAPYKKESLMWRQETDILNTKNNIEKVINLLETIDAGKFNADTAKNAVWLFATEKGRGFVLWPMRYALSAAEKSPDPFIIAGILGKEETLRRLNIAHDAIKNT